MPEQIAIILSAPMFLRVVTTPIITSMADRAEGPGECLIAIAVAAVAGVARLFPDADAMRCVLAVTSALLNTVLDAAIAARPGAVGRPALSARHYPKMRIWGSLSLPGRQVFGGGHPACRGERPTPVPVMITVGLFGALVAAI